VGSRRLICYADGWFNSRVELHCDGSGSVATQLPTRSGQSLASEDPPGVWDTLIAWWTASALLYLARHALERAGASGVAATAASLHSYIPIANAPSVLGGSTSIWTPGPYDGGVRHGNQRLREALGRADFLLDSLAGDGQPLAAAAGELVNDLLQCFGAVEARQFALDGTLRLHAWGSDSRYVKAWAEETGIPIEP
jgi:hypothetical protein